MSVSAEENVDRFKLMAEESEAEAWVIPAEWDAVTHQLLAGAFAVHTALGPGLPERLYEDALARELVLRGLKVDRQREVRLTYKGLALPPMRLDLVVNDLVIVELKAVESVPDIYLATLVSYLNASGIPLGLLLNFNTRRLKDGIYGRIHKNANV
ncbi:MAG: GxxExxY protein [Phycisphaerales bacterium]|nr:GxxExxY protein [Phycisphaerales bacterium]